MRIGNVVVTAVMLVGSACASTAETLPGESGLASELSTCRTWMAGRTSSDAPEILRSGARTLCVDIGNGMTEEMAERFVGMLREVPGPQPPHVVVRSLGGQVDNGMLMGEAIVDLGAAVHVFGFCASSCANYLFLPASERHVMEESVVFFHGGLVVRHLSEPVLSEEGRTKTSASLARQSRLLARSGIDPDLFEWMDRLNEDDGALERVCPDKPDIAVLLLSEDTLKRAGAPLASNHGPDSQATSDRVMGRYGLAEVSCFWQ